MGSEKYVDLWVEGVTLSVTSSDVTRDLHLCVSSPSGTLSLSFDPGSREGKGETLQAEKHFALLLSE